MGIFNTGPCAIESIAGEFILKGPLVQGGLVIGHTKPGAQVAINGNKIRVSKQGMFLIGFGRNAKNTSRLYIKFPDNSKIQKTLKIKKRTYAVQRIDGLPSRQVTPDTKDLDQIKNDNNKIAHIRRLDTLSTGFTSGFQWPAIGPITGVFGSQRILNGNAKAPHNGVDVAAPRGSPVIAAANGTIALVQSNMFYTGKTVMIDHGHGLSTVYIHMDKIFVTNGTQVNKGDKIGVVGSTGRATGPHLHWGASLFDVHLDPSLLVDISLKSTSVKKLDRF
jgi:murein DD-endopeptidase MepM/ murein hydrolase activator NlpD